MGLFNKLSEPVFLKEESDTKQFIDKLNELREKAPKELRQKIDREIKLASIGEKGEANIAFELKNSGMPMYILHDLHFEIDGLSAQIDYIVITRRITFIIECKNLIGNIEIDNQGNFIRRYELNGKYIKEGIYSPITQNQRHLQIIRKIGKQSKGNMITKMIFDKNFDEYYKSIVVLANPKTILNARYAKKEVKNKVIRADQLNNYIKSACEKCNLMDASDKEMKRMAEKFLSLHKPNKSDYVKKYEDIINSLENIDDIKPNKEEIHHSYRSKVYNFNNKTSAPKSDNKSAPKNDNTVNTYDKDTNSKNVNTIKNQDKLIQELKAFRLKESRRQNIKPYFIFNNKQMMDLINKMPSSKEELQKVSGFGQVKAEKYGDMIIKILNE